MTPSLGAQQFPDRPFTVAEARDHGVSRKRLGARDLAAPFWGVRMKNEGDAATRSDPDTTPGRCRAFALRMPEHAVFSHVTAAELHGLPLPRALRNLASLDVTVPEAERAIDAKDIRGHCHRLDPNDVEVLAGLRVTTAARTWCDLAAVLDQAELVAVGDRILLHDKPRATRDELTRAVEAHGRRWGARPLRAVLPRLSDRAESPRESRLRVMIVDAGFPEPYVNPEIPCTCGSTHRIDLAYPALHIGIEYDGDHHRTDQRQWRKDVARIRHLEALGWSMARVTASDLDSPAALFRSLRDKIDERIRSLTR
ncbi:hypothetical protein [Herbiconiux sp. A18JL235]|uniref:DUF559 domain-containing protein n=1 Tax=Herbiconiux sp. A18JL235 TaxID=3152363 RepID=A0AB39BK85_9MICO